MGAGSGNGRSPQGTGDVVIKIFSGGSSTPFSGVVDPGGYFFIPFIPAGAPFTAVAHDKTTGETRVIDGIGPALGDFEFMFFDFFSEPAETDTITWDGGGDGTSWHDANNWSGDVVPGAADDVLIDVPGNITVTHSFGSHAVRSLHSEEAILLTGGTLDIGATSILSQTLALMGGTLSGNGDLTLNGLLLWRQGTMSGLGTTIANGDIHFIDNLSYVLMDGRTLINSGTAVWQNGGYLIAYFGSTIINLPGATFHFQGDLVVSGPTTWNMGTMSGAGTTTAMGGLTFTGNNFRVLDGRMLANSGTAVFEDGWLNINNSGLLHNTSTATWDFLGDDVLSTNVGGGTFQNDGSLTKLAGSGTATIGATFINNGDVFVQSGALQFGGEFAQTANGTLFVQIGGLVPITEFDQYRITGAAALDGTLDVTLTGGFLPNPGDNFAVMTFASHTGQFATINGHGQGYTATYNAANVTLTAQ